MSGNCPFVRFRNLNIITFLAAGMLLASQKPCVVGGEVTGGAWLVVPTLPQPAIRNAGKRSAAVNAFDREVLMAISWCDCPARIPAQALRDLRSQTEFHRRRFTAEAWD